MRTFLDLYMIPRHLEIFWEVVFICCFHVNLLSITTPKNFVDDTSDSLLLSIDKEIVSAIFYGVAGKA